MNDPYGFLAGAINSFTNFGSNIGQKLGGLLVNPERANPNTRAVATTIPTTFSPANNTTKSNYTSTPQNLINTAFQAVKGVFNPSSIGVGVGFTQGYSAGGAVALTTGNQKATPLSLQNIPGTIANVSQGIVSIGKSISDAANALGFRMNRSVLDTSTSPAVNSIGGQNSLDLAGLISSIGNTVQVAATSGYERGLGAFQSFSPTSAPISSASSNNGSEGIFPTISPTIYLLFGAVLIAFMLTRRAKA